MSGAMPEMEIAVKVGILVLIGLLGAVIVAYHTWMDRRRPRRETPVETAHEARPADRPSPS